MKKFLTRGLVGVGALAIPLGASLTLLPGAAFAGTTAGQGAQTAPLVTGGTPVCGAPGVVGTTSQVGNSFATEVLDRTTGDVTNTVHLQGANRNQSYYVVLYDQNCAPQHMLDGTNPVVSTNAQGNGTMSFVANDPTITSAHVVMWVAPDWSGTPFASATVPLS
jgi:hypothetical protein